MSDEPEISPIAVVILNWNGSRDTVECLESLLQQECPGSMAVVVDNGSTDDSLQHLRAWAQKVAIPFTCITRAEAETEAVSSREAEPAKTLPQCRMVLITNDANLGFAAGNNVGLRYALGHGFSLVMILNNDMILPRGTLASLAGCLARHPEWVGVGPKVVERNNPSRILFAGGALRLWQARAVHLARFAQDSEKWTRERTTGHLSMCCALYRGDFLRQAGLLDEEFFFGQEDVAFSVLARRAGRKLGVYLDATVHHAEGSSLKKSPETSIYYYAKYRLLLLRKYGSLKDRLIAALLLGLSRIVKFLFLLLLGRWRRVRAEVLGYWDFFHGRLGDYDRRVAARSAPKAHS